MLKSIHSFYKRNNFFSILFFILFIISICCGCISLGGEKKPNTQYISDGVSLYRQGKCDDAITSFQKYLAVDQNSTDAAFAWWMEALCLDEVGRDSEALQSINQAIKISPRDPNFWSAKERILYNLGLFSEADEASEKVILLTASAAKTRPTTIPTTGVVTTPRPTVTRPPTTTKVPTPTLSPTLAPVLSTKDSAFIEMATSRRQELYELSVELQNLTWFDYQSYGRMFTATTQSFYNEAQTTMPDNPVLHQAWTYYTEALKSFIIAGEWEEKAGTSFTERKYSLATEELLNAVSNLERGNENLTMMDSVLTSFLPPSTMIPVMTRSLTPTPSPTPSPTPVPTLSTKDSAFIEVSSNRRQELYELSVELQNLTWFDYQSYGRKFTATAESFSSEAQMTMPDNPTLHQAWAFYTEALKYFIQAGQWEEKAGTSFIVGKYSLAAEELQNAISNLERGNENLTMMDSVLENSGYQKT